jgi:hypothetical protein
VSPAASSAGLGRTDLGIGRFETRFSGSGKGLHSGGQVSPWPVGVSRLQARNFKNDTPHTTTSSF